ncbi:MAG: hypothetical protein IJG36_12245 [Synergistaceae bacterium]|nr:hypothetical protein [Synergistaceae bacterium]
MPFLRAANIQGKKPALTTHEKPRLVCDETIMETVRMWMHEDDISTNAELAFLGLL